MRLVPAGRSTTSPAPFNTLRCWETAGRLTGSSLAISPTARGRVARLSKIARRVGSPSALNACAWLVGTNRKLALTATERNLERPARQSVVERQRAVPREFHQRRGALEL